jgi:hypothetical protein
VKTAKGEGNDARCEHSQTPFERFQKFVRAVVTVPKRELPTQERKFQQERKKRKRKHHP